MSQFNSIFSPLTNKLARLAGITLLAVAALFASTQQMSAQTTCVQNLNISLERDCKMPISPEMVSLTGTTANHYVMINDNTPGDSNVVNTISPAIGWTYGLFDKTTKALICQGTIIVRDDQGPVFSAQQLAAWQTIDTVVTWSDNVYEIVNQSASWGGAFSFGSDGRISAPSFTNVGKYYVGRPYMTDSCEVDGSNGMINPLATSTTKADSTWLIDKDSSGTASGRDSFLVHRSKFLSYKVTDYLETPGCDSVKAEGKGFTHKLTRRFNITDRRGNDTTLTQIIYFVKPSSGRESNPLSRTGSSAYTISTDPMHRGPGNLGQFGAWGSSPRRTKQSVKYGETDQSRLVNGSVVTGTYSKDFASQIGYDIMTAANFNQGKDTIKFNISTGNLTPITVADIPDLLTVIYKAVDTLPSGQVDSLSLLSNELKDLFAVSYQTKEFSASNALCSKKFEVVTTVFDWCYGSQEVDTLILAFEDLTAPTHVVYNLSANGGAIKGRRNPADSVIISVGTYDCTANLKLPTKNAGDRSNLADLSALFNWGITDKVASNNSTDGNGAGVNLNYKIQTRDSWNNGYFTDRTDFVDQNYTVATIGAAPQTQNVAMGIPVGEHRIVIEAYDNCQNYFFDTLYFDVQDKVAPVMKCDDQINVTLTSNSSTNYYINGPGFSGSLSDRAINLDQYARVTVDMVNEGSLDNCTLDSMYVRRKFNWATCRDYMVWNMDYDIFGDNNGSVTTADFEPVKDNNGVNVPDMYYTPKYMQYVEFFCCDGFSVNPVVELWGSDLAQPSPWNTDNYEPLRNWSFCWTEINLEDKTPPRITAPDLSKDYNTTYNYNGRTVNVQNWVNCTDKEIIGNSSDNTSGDIAKEVISNGLFGKPDIYGLECRGDVKYSVIKKLTCDTGVILRIWEVTKEIKAGSTVTVRDTQLIWVQANHDYTIKVPGDITNLTCGQNISDSKVTYDADGCDLLAISAYNQKTYDAGDGEIACKKVYRTWTVINWCILPNQFMCNNADPGLYARIIPRLSDLNLEANAQNDAITMEHRFTKSVSSTARIKVATGANSATGIGNHGLPFALRGNPSFRTQPWASTAVTGATTLQHRKVFTNATNWTPSTRPYPVLSPAPSCSIDEQTFAWQYTQVIKVTDNTKPVLVLNTAQSLDFTAVDDDGATGSINWNADKKVFGIRGNLASGSLTTYEAPSGNECLAKVKFSFTFKDTCAFSGPFALDKASVVLANAANPSTTTIGNQLGKNFNWVGGINKDDDISNIIIIPNDLGAPLNGGTQATFEATIDNLPVDAADGDGVTGFTTYQLLVTVRDDCGNVTVERIDFTVGDIKAPAPVCVGSLEVSLMPTNDGNANNAGMVRVFAKDVFQDINRNWNNDECGGSNYVVSRIVRKSADIATTADGKRLYPEYVDFNCADLLSGGDYVNVYLIDAAGNYNYCQVNVIVRDNASICPDGQSSAAVAGAIQTETKATVEGVQVNLSGQAQKSFATGVNGLFVFNNLTAGADYTVTPSLNKGFLNGVSTFDLVLISKHILGVQPLNTPYKLIAADVNNSKSVTTLDLIQLRKLILNIDATFANNSSWRFVDASYTFPNASNPWAASFPEVKNVNDLVGSLSANFVAVKVGDVNGNAIANSTQGSVRNLTSNLGINVADMNMVAGNEYKVDFTAADLNGIEGFQFTLNLDKKGLELVDLVPGIAAEENFGIFAEEGVVTASWNGEAKGGVLFSLVVRAKSNTTLSEVLNLNSRYTAAEAYKGGEVVNVGLNFNASKASANYELYQNTPNPFAGESIIGFNLPVAGAATLTIQDVTGRTLKVINGQYAKGYNQVSLKSTELSATGVLTYTLKAADFTATRKMIIVE